MSYFLVLFVKNKIQFDKPNNNSMAKKQHSDNIDELNVLICKEVLQKVSAKACRRTHYGYLYDDIFHLYELCCYKNKKTVSKIELHTCSKTLFLSSLRKLGV